MTTEGLASSRGWRRFELHLLTAGMALEGPMLNIAPLDARDLQYRLPSTPQLVLLADDSVSLEWQKPRDWHALSPPPGHALENFIRLDEAPAERLLTFAAAWGPVNDEGFEEFGDEPDRIQWHFSESLADGRMREPVDGWRRRARQLGALLRGAASLQKSESITLADRHDMLYGGHLGDDGTKRLGARVVDPRGSERCLLPADATLNQQRSAVASLAAEWIPASDLVLIPQWDPDSHSAALRIKFLAQRQPLVAVLGIELAVALSSPAGVWGCDGCPYPYTPNRTPRRDRRRFCPECSKSRAPARLWWRQHRSRHQKDRR
jgi:hypothetical protein